MDIRLQIDGGQSSGSSMLSFFQTKSRQRSGKGAIRKKIPTPKTEVGKNQTQRTIGPENAHLKPDLGVLSHNEMTLTLNTHTPLLTS